MREGAYATSRRVPLVVVRGGRVVDETAERDADVVISDGRIVAVGENLDVAGGATVLEAHGCIVCPGLVDLHAHLREPGGEDAESVETGARAASLGGFTAVVAMPNTDPPIDNAAVATEVMSLGARATCRVDVAGAITVGRMGERLAPLAELYALGVRIFTDDGSAVQDAGVMRRALEYAKGLDHRAVRAVLAQHCEVEALSAGGAMNEGIWSSLLGVPGSPVEAEELMVERDIALAALTGGRVHFMHLSSARSAGLVESAKARGLAVSAEVTPHHLALSDERLRSFDPLYKVNPPLRTPKDVMALRRACARGTVDAVATDHAPHPTRSKEEPLEQASFGMLGLETALAVAMGSLCRGEPMSERHEARRRRPSRGDDPGEPAALTDTDSEPRMLEVRELLGLMCWRPARIAGMALSQGGDQGGPITEGAPANLCVFDPSETWVVDPSRLASRSRNTPWAGQKLNGKVRHTVFMGEPVVVDGEATR